MGETEEGGLSRRSFVKRGAIAGGAAVWALPVIDSFTSPAAGQTRGTPACECFFCATITGGTVLRCEPVNPADCDCVCCCGEIESSCPSCANADPCSVEVQCVVDPTCSI